MNLTAILLFSACLTVSAKGFSQITLSEKNTPLQKVFKRIQKQSGYDFLFSYTLVQNAGNVTVDLKNVSLQESVEEVLKGKNLTYEIVEKTVVIKPKPESPNKPVIVRQDSLIELTGTVSNENGDILPGVSVALKGTQSGATTDANGNYSIRLSGLKGTLVFSHVSYEQQEVLISNRKQINVVMKSKVSDMEQIVVVGYGTQKKVTVTGSVVAVQGGDVAKNPSTNVSNSLVGRLPGLSSVQRSGEPGRDGSTILIRGINTLGDNSPLIVVDGVPGRSLDRIDPGAVESVTVLKDASAAIYGAQAANGVILVTTKRGKSGKPQITFNLNRGFNRPTVIPKMANAWEYATMLNEIDIYAGRAPRTSAEELQKLKENNNDPWNYPNTDWFATVLKPWSNQNYMNVSMTGGNDRLKYYFLLGSKFEDGYYHNSSSYFKQYNLHSNIDGKISDNVSVTFDIVGRMEDQNYPSRPASTIFRMLKRADPRMHASWPDGTPGEDVGEGDNPAIISTDAAGYDKNKWYVFNSSLKLNVNIPWVKGLSFTGNASLDKSFLLRKLWQTPWYLYSWDHQSYDDQNNPVLKQGIKGFSDARLTESMQDNKTLLLYGTVNYKKVFGENTVNLLAGMESRTGDGEAFSAYRRYFISSAIDALSLGGNLEKDNSGSAYADARLNYFGRFNYNYMEKYLLEFVWRYDGSYIFPEKGRFGFFPGVSVGWRLSEEKFMRDNLPFINDLKLRASWGQTGNDRIAAWQYLSTYAFGSIYDFGAGQQNTTLYEARIPNEDITWEVANQANIGFDALLLNNKLSISLDVYSNKRTHILAFRNASIPTSSGLSLPRENIGRVGNKGFEFSIGYNNRINDFKYNVSVNGGYAKNKILFWDETPGVDDWQKSTGRPVGANLYYEAIGIFRDSASVKAYPHWDRAQAGDIIFKDVNNDGVINGLDRVRSNKTTTPVFTGALNISLAYKQFDLSLLLQGATGAVRYFDTESGDIGNYVKYDFIDRWTPDNPDAKKPRAYNRTDVYWKGNESTHYLLNADYVRLKTIELGYTLPGSISTKIGINSLRIYFSAYNLFTYSPGLHDYDPETVTEGAYAGQYPPQKVINGGITLTF
ncbi:MAG: TonB-dependent receptor [Chitinophagaceae bacterium]|nr:TonB-dependent receptor [Chitinophagaceae bacterium]